MSDCTTSTIGAFAQRISLGAGLLAGVAGVCCMGGRAQAATPDDVQYSVQASIASGSVDGNVIVATVPAGKLLVITSVTYYRFNSAANTIGQLFLTTIATGTGAYTALPEAKADGAQFPSATLTTTLYADAGTKVAATVYTSATATSTETDYISVTGYLLPQK